MTSPNRFALSMVGVAVATVASPSPADDITITMHLDYWAGEHGMTLSNASGGIRSYVSGGEFVAVADGTANVRGTSLAAWTSGVSPYTSGYRWIIDGDIQYGVAYAVQLTDSYGDGWAWNEVTGADAFQFSGIGAVGDTMIGFESGSSRTGSVILVPGPTGLALLGLAGIERGRRGRRRDLEPAARFEL